ncbi:hypothetical protein [Sphingomonas sp.]|jgi:hypothetical protein|uniref:hypothetical protein n=1 Tax=Sphingomonas sp. TaxID=28214 RepID=UPI002D7EFB1C|nr:hypothetical protein [Sphingomonas sp.]HEU0045822.1 hypothetical protein [Sphingomonas sp.]
MRIALALIALIVAAPAVAREPARPTPEQAAAALGNPLMQEAAARALTQLVGIVLDTRVGGAAALDPSVRPDDTLRDLARRDDPRFEERLYRDTKRAMGTAAVVAGGAAAQAREIKRTADRLEAALAPLLGALGDTERY